MKQKSRYVFGAALAGAAFGGVPQMIQRAHAAPITAGGFSFETSGQAFFPTVSGTSTSTATQAGTTTKATLTNTTTGYSTPTTASIGPFIAESGAGSAYGVHTSASTAYSRAAGNGSAIALSSTQWAAGDYYQFSVPTTLIDNVVVSFDQISSGTGPGQFTLQYSTGGAYSTVAGYTIPYITYSFSTTSAATTYTTGTGSSGFSSGTSNTALSFAFDLSSITGLNEDASASFRLVDANAVSLNGGTVGTSGTDRVDNFVVSGTAVPEPATVSLLALSAVGLMARRRETKE